MLATHLTARTAPRGSATDAPLATDATCSAQPTPWRREGRACIPHCPVPLLAPLQPVSVNQSVSILPEITMCSSQHERWRRGTLRIGSHTTQVALTQTRDPHVGESAGGPPAPLASTSPPIPETCITRIHSLFLRCSQENLYLIYGQFIMEIDHIKCIQMCRAVYRAWRRQLSLAIINVKGLFPAAR